jgi:hypothetical protein
MKRWLAASGALLLWAAVAWGVPSKQYVVPGTPVTFGDAAQTPTITLTLTALASGAGQYSGRVDKGAGAQPAWWEWQCHVQLTGTNVVDEVVEVYVAWSDGTTADGGLGTTTAALVTAKRKNLKLVGLLVVDQTTSNTTMSGSGLAYLPMRFYNVGLWNATSLPFKTDTAVHGCVFTPVPVEMQ